MYEAKKGLRDIKNRIEEGMLRREEWKRLRNEIGYEIMKLR